MKPGAGKPALPEDVGMYLDTIRQRFPKIDAVWLLEIEGDRPVVTWPLLAFANQKILSDMRDDPGLRRDDVELLIVTDGDRIESVWGDKPTATLSAQRWRLDSPDTASYRAAGAKRKRATASRVR